MYTIATPPLDGHFWRSCDFTWGIFSITMAQTLIIGEVHGNEVITSPKTSIKCPISTGSLWPGNCPKRHLSEKDTSAV